jgi:hypothetical protein
VNDSDAWVVRAIGTVSSARDQACLVAGADGRVLLI